MRERNKILADKCVDHLQEAKMYKIEVDYVAEAMQEKDPMFETLEKEKADYLLMQQKKASELEEMDQAKSNLEKKVKELKECTEKLQKALVSTVAEKKKVIQDLDMLKR